MCHSVSGFSLYMLCLSSRRDRTPGTVKRRFAYFLTVVNFRKPVNTQKSGSRWNGHPLIYPRGYVADYYQVVNVYVRGK